MRNIVKITPADYPDRLCPATTATPTQELCPAALAATVPAAAHALDQPQEPASPLFEPRSGLPGQRLIGRHRRLRKVRSMLVTGVIAATPPGSLVTAGRDLDPLIANTPADPDAGCGEAQKASRA